MFNECDNDNKATMEGDCFFYSEISGVKKHNRLTLVQFYSVTL